LNGFNYLFTVLTVTNKKTHLAEGLVKLLMLKLIQKWVLLQFNHMFIYIFH